MVKIDSAGMLANKKDWKLHCKKMCLDGRHIPKHIFVTLFLMRLNSKHVEFHDM